MRADEQALQLMQKMVDTGECHDMSEVFSLVHTRNPELMKRRRTEGPERREVAKQTMQLTSLKKTVGLEVFENLVKQIMTRQPSLTTEEARQHVAKTDIGRQALENHRFSMLYER